MPTVLRTLQIPINVLPGSRLFEEKRKDALCVSDIRSSLGLDGNTLRRLQGIGDCFIAAHPSPHGVRLFDRAKLQETLERRASAVTARSFARLVGLAVYMVDAFIELNIVHLLNDHDAQILAGNQTLLDPDSVTEFSRQLNSLGAKTDPADGLPLSCLLARELNPWVWAVAFDGVLSGNIDASLSKGDGNTVQSLIVRPVDFHIVTAAARLKALPNMAIAACVASVVLGTSDVVLAAAAREGLIAITDEGLNLQSLAEFHENYILPSEIREWRPASAHAFGRSMRAAGATPVACVAKNIIWKRADVEAVFPESAILEFKPL